MFHVPEKSLPKSKLQYMVLTSHVCILIDGTLASEFSLLLFGIHYMAQRLIVRMPILYLKGSELTMGVRYRDAASYQIQFWSRLAASRWEDRADQGQGSPPVGSAWEEA